MEKSTFGKGSVIGTKENLDKFFNLFLTGDDTEDYKKPRFFARTVLISKDHRDIYKSSSMEPNIHLANFRCSFNSNAYNSLIDSIGTYPHNDPGVCVTLKEAVEEFDLELELHTSNPDTHTQEDILVNDAQIYYTKRIAIFVDLNRGRGY